MISLQNQTKLQFHFSYQFTMNDCEIFLDHERKTTKLVLEGRVNQETTECLLTYVADIIEGGLINKILMDRQKLIQFDTGAKNWIKEVFVPKRLKDLSKDIEKIAVINECSVAALFYGDQHSEDTVFDKLNLQKFDKITEAEEWLLT